MGAISRLVRGLALAVATLVAAGAAVPAAAQMGGNSDFTAAEKRRLEDGHIVMRRLTQQRGQLRLIGGTSWQVVDLPPDVVWRALQDIQHYNKMLPRVKKVTVVEKHGDIKTLHVVHDVAGPKIHYYVNVRFTARKREAFFQLDNRRAGSLDAAWGFLRITERDGKSLLSWGVMADVGSGIVSGMLRPVVHKWLLKVPTTIKKWVEGSGKSRYVD